MKNKTMIRMVSMGWMLGLAVTAGAASNVLTAAEKAAGWRLLFDGETASEWRSLGKGTFPDRGWVIEDGWLRKLPDVRGGDILTKDRFTDFEFAWDWRISKGGNNGVKYMIIEKRGPIGHEYQMLDDMDGARGKSSTASFYEVLAPADDKPMKRAGEVNHSRIRVKGRQVEHWLNGRKVLQYELGSKQVLEGVSGSKFKKVAGFGEKVTGHILLTDHNDECWFQNLKVRELK